MRLHAAVPARQILAVGIEHAKPAPGVLERSCDADVVLLPPSNPVVSIGTILAVAGVRDAWGHAAPVVGVSPIIGGAPVRGMADACLAAIGVETSATAVAGLYARLPRRWLVSGDDASEIPQPAGAGPSAAHVRSGRDPSAGPRGVRPGRDAARRGRRVSVLTVTGVEGLPEISAGDDLAALIASRVPDLSSAAVVVVTSKVVSKAEGRSTRADGREAAISAETVRIVASRGDTRIVETRHGLVLAAAGVDSSNTAAGPSCSCPRTPMPPPAGSGPGCTATSGYARR